MANYKDISHCLNKRKLVCEILILNNNTGIFIAYQHNCILLLFLFSRFNFKYLLVRKINHAIKDSLSINRYHILSNI